MKLLACFRSILLATLCLAPKFAMAESSKISASQAIQEIAQIFSKSSQWQGLNPYNLPCFITAESLEGIASGLRLTIKSENRVTVVDLLANFLAVSRVMTDYKESLRMMYTIPGTGDDYSHIEIQIQKSNGSITLGLAPFEPQNMPYQDCRLAH